MHNSMCQSADNTIATRLPCKKSVGVEVPESLTVVSCLPSTPIAGHVYSPFTYLTDEGEGAKFCGRVIGRAAYPRHGRNGPQVTGLEGKPNVVIPYASRLEALQDHATKQGYDVLDQVADDGYSGITLERPGLDRVREMVETGGVDLVIAQDRDRIAREPAFHYLLETEFKRYGTKLAALNDWGGDTPEGQLLRGIQDQVAKYERLLIAERTRRGKLRRAKEGKVVPTGAVPLGFSYTGDTYVVDPQTMSTVRRIFELAAAGESMYRVRLILNSEGIGTPRGGKFWSPNTLRRIVGYDIYLPRDYTEVAELVDTRKLHKPLDPAARYGVVWYSHIPSRYTSQEYRVTPWKPHDGTSSGRTGHHAPITVSGSYTVTRSARAGRC